MCCHLGRGKHVKRVRVLLADDYPPLAESLRDLLQPEFDVVGIVGDGHSLIQAAGQLAPDVIVADVTMPRLNGIGAIEELRKAGSRAAVILLTMHHDTTYVHRGLKAGASGFVLKQSAFSDLATAVREALEGRTYLSPSIAREALLR